MDVDRADPHDLRRFVDAQAPVYAQVRDELAARPQAQPLDVVRLPAAERPRPAARWRIATASPRAPRRVAYLAHPLLGARLVECTA